MATVNKTPNIQVRSGNTMRVVFGGVEIGLLQDLSASDDYSPEPASGIGDIHVQEYVPTMARHSLRTSQMVLLNQSLREAGVASINGDDALKGLVFDIEVFDKRDAGRLLRKYRKCNFASGEVDIRKHAIVVNNCQLQALDVEGTGL